MCDVGSMCFWCAVVALHGLGYGYVDVQWVHYLCIRQGSTA
jgi:hypothetical protein